MKEDKIIYTLEQEFKISINNKTKEVNFLNHIKLDRLVEIFFLNYCIKNNLNVYKAFKEQELKDWNSIDILFLENVIRIEDLFDIQIYDEEVENIVSISDLINIIKEKTHGSIIK